MTSSFPASTVLGYPRIGPDRELKRALESYWEGRSSRADLEAETARRLREDTWRRLAALGLEGLPSNTFSLLRPGARHRGAARRGARAVHRHGRRTWTPTSRWPGAPRAIAAAGDDQVVRHQLPLPRPRARPGHRLRARRRKPLAELREARALGIATRPVLIGP